MFGLGKPKQPAITRAQQLGARPRRLVEAEAVETEGGGARLTVAVTPRGVQKWLLRLPEGTTKTFELDSVGYYVWQLCDGKTSCQALITKVARHLKITPREAEVATLTFVQTLVRKGLIGVEIRERKPAEKGAAKPDSSDA